MKNLRCRSFDVVIKTLTAGMLILAWSYQSAAQEQPTMSAFELLPGVIVAPDRSMAYIMSPEGGIDAVELAEGTVVWSTVQAAKPLALAGKFLIGQAEPSDAGNELEIVTLDTQQRGQRVVAGTMGLPAGVQVSIDKTLNSSFVASARAMAGEALVSWQAIKRPEIRGIPPGVEETFGLETPLVLAPAVALPTSGSFQMDLSSGATSTVQVLEAPVTVVARAAELPVAERLPQVPGDQFVSVDGGHVLTCQRIDDDRGWEQ